MVKVKIKRIGALVYDKWFSLVLCYVSLYLAYISYRQEGYTFMAFALIAVLIKLMGLIFNHRRLRLVGIICINVIWAITILDFVKMGQPFYFSLFALLIGIGISLKGRFDE
jgi:hypothetical protein